VENMLKRLAKWRTSLSVSSENIKLLGLAAQLRLSPPLGLAALLARPLGLAALLAKPLGMADLGRERKDGRRGWKHHR
jgi:hypothetical protein